MAQSVMKIISISGDIEYLMEDELFALLEHNRTKFRFVFIKIFYVLYSRIGPK